MADTSGYLGRNRFNNAVTFHDANTVWHTSTVHVTALTPLGGTYLLDGMEYQGLVKGTKQASACKYCGGFAVFVGQRNQTECGHCGAPR